MKQYRYYLKEYVGRETPLFYAEKTSKKLGGAKIYLKREDLNHTGAHKINNVLGQILLAKRMGKKKVIAQTGAGHHAQAFCGSVGVIHGMKTYMLCDEDGNITPTHSISAGLDYPGVGPEHAYLESIGRVKYESATDKEAVSAFLELSNVEGIIPAIESSHALAIFEQKQFKPDDIVVVSLSGRGDKDLQNYIDYFNL